MNIIKLSGLAGLSLVALSTFNACTDYTPFNDEDILKHEYSVNFFKKYGNFPDDMNWDLSETLPRTGAIDGSVFDLGCELFTGMTRAEHPFGQTDVVTRDTWYHVPTTAIDKLYKNILVEGRNNTGLGKPFAFEYSTPQSGEVNAFAIIPIFKGYGELKWKLHLATSTTDVILWDPQWTEITVNETNYYQMTGFEFNKNSSDDANGDWTNITLSDDMSKEASEHLRKNVRSHPIVVNNLSGEFYLYLEITDRSLRDPDDRWTYVGEQQSSKEGMMLALTEAALITKNGDDETFGDPESVATQLGIDVTTPAFKALVGVEESMAISEVMVIGCEDCKWSDWDINDISFLCVGLNKLPRKRIAVSKRYMIEDLGSTVDWDFNDIVVDVTETYLEKTGENPTYGPADVLTQEATIKHLCGTVPFEVYFKDETEAYDNTVTFGSMYGKVQGVNEEYKNESGEYVKRTYVQSGGSKPFWNSAGHNIRVKVGANQYHDAVDWNSIQNDQSNVFYEVKFNKPEKGSTVAPQIIALPITEKWTDEHQDIPDAWMGRSSSPDQN